MSWRSDAERIYEEQGIEGVAAYFCGDTFSCLDCDFEAVDFETFNDHIDAYHLENYGS